MLTRNESVCEALVILRSYNNFFSLLLAQKYLKLWTWAEQSWPDGSHIRVNPFLNCSNYSVTTCTNTVENKVTAFENIIYNIVCALVLSW